METLYETRKLKYSFTIAILFWLIVKTFAANPSDTKDFVKTIEEQYSIESDGTVHLENKYGEVNVETWNKNEVHIKVEITVDAKNEEKAEEIFDRININFEKSSDLVKAVTDIGKKPKSWFSWFSDGSEKFKINYTVNMPITAELELHNKYGNVVIDQLNNDCRLFVKYGNFTVDKIDGDLDLQLGYGKGKLAYVKDLSGALKYSSLHVEELGEIEMETKYSKIDIQHGNSAKINSKYDNYKVDQIRDFDIVTKYTDIVIEELENSGDFQVSYGGVIIKSLKEGFESIEGEAKYTGFKIDMEDNVSYSFDLSTKYGDINVPSKSNMQEESQESTSITRRGKVGNKSEGGTISITTKYGNIDIH